MPAGNKGKGGKKKRRGKKEDEGQKRPLKTKLDGESYAKVTKLLGDCRLLVTTLPEGKEVVAHIRGKFRKRVWIREDDIVLIGLRNNDEKGDVVWKFNDDEVKQLCKKKEIALDDEKEKNNEDMWEISDDSDDSEFGSEEESEEEQKPRNGGRDKGKKKHDAKGKHKTTDTKKEKKVEIPAGPVYTMPPSDSDESIEDWKEALDNL